MIKKPQFYFTCHPGDMIRGRTIRGSKIMLVATAFWDEKKDEEGIGLTERMKFKVGNWPRHFKVENNGVIYVACQYENLVQRFRWEGEK